MYALDANLLIYAHNTASPFHPQAKALIEKVMNERDAEGKLSICIPGQVLMEFLNVITRHNSNRRCHSTMQCSLSKII